jgi:serine/threonine protein kinase
MSVVLEQTQSGVIIEIPRQFQRYAYVHTLGSASSSVVVLVKDKEGSQYAAKMVSRAALVTEQRLEYFERELRVLEFVRHPHIVRLHEIVYLPDIIGVVMEYCEGGDLFDHMVRTGPLRPSVLRRFLYQILKGLECLHDKGYAHRDLKPDNIFVDKSGRVTIGDFGFAKASSGMTSTICGTLDYTAPEILQEKNYDGRKADIWSIGILIYVMGSRILPWTSPDSAGVAAEIKAGVIPMPLDFPMELRNLIQMCTKMDPKERPTPTQLLETQWLREEQVPWARQFGVAGKKEPVSRSLMASKGSVARESAKLILSKPTVRPFNSEKLRMSGVSLPDPL